MKGSKEEFPPESGTLLIVDKQSVLSLCGFFRFVANSSEYKSLIFYLIISYLII